MKTKRKRFSNAKWEANLHTFVMIAATARALTSVQHDQCERLTASTHDTKAL